MGCGVSSGINAQQPQAHAQSRAVPQTPHGTVVQPQALPQANAQQMRNNNAGPQGMMGNSDTQMTAPIMRSLVNLHRDSLEYGTETGDSFVAFRFDSSADGCDVTVHFLVHEEAPSHGGGLPSYDGAFFTKRERFRRGLKQDCKIVIGRGLDLQADLKVFDAEKDGHHHLIIELAAQSTDPNTVTRQLSYFKLSQSDDKFSLALTKQKAVCWDNSCRELSTLYGNFARPKRSPSGRDQVVDTEDSAGGGGDGAECVICLTNPRDTVIIPCRHVCLCSTCADVTSSTWSFQCPVCRARVAAMVKLRPEP